MIPNVRVQMSLKNSHFCAPAFTPCWEQNSSCQGQAPTFLLHQWTQLMPSPEGLKLLAPSNARTWPRIRKRRWSSSSSSSSFCGAPIWTEARVKSARAASPWKKTAMWDERTTDWYWTSCRPWRSYQGEIPFHRISHVKVWFTPCDVPAVGRCGRRN